PRLSLLGRICTLLIGLSALFSGTARVDQPAAIWQQANQLYQQEQYEQAAAAYHRLDSAGFQSASLYYNLGNCYYRMSHIAPAVLYYERALFLDPTNSIIKDNLQLAQARVDPGITTLEPMFLIRWWNHLQVAFSPSVWGIVAFLIFLSLLTLIYGQQRRPIAFFGRWLALASCLLIGAFLMLYLSYRQYAHTDKMVVMEPETPFFETANMTATPESVLPEGLVVHFSRAQGNRYAVRLPNGNEGWVAAERLQKVQPE